MTGGIPRERTATAAELADEAARAERARTGRQRPRTLHTLCEQAAVLVLCGQCWAPRGTPCSRGLRTTHAVLGPPGYHVTRFAEARRRGLITEAELTSVLGRAGSATIIGDGAG